MSTSKLILGTLLLLPMLAQALPINKQLVIRPIQICNSAGDCANEQQDLFEDIDDKVWAQAGIDIRYEGFTSIIDSTALDVSFTELFGSFSPPPSSPVNWFETVQGGVPDQDVINLWFARSLPNNIVGFTDADADPLTGAILSVRNNILISDDIFGSIGSDAIAHEIGHVLGLAHCGSIQGFPPRYVACPGELATDPENFNLMMPSGIVNLTTANIAPDGSMFDFLTAAQIDAAEQAPFLIDRRPVPTPAPWSLLLLSIVLMLVQFKGSDSLNVEARHLVG